ncbi:hypothetical protein [Longimicrobium sp.]|uniref:hypothetical protein n=1 Tax=Longimicrobium sp. TaxID=2029185 RepID=UPI002BCB4311|nr:hypothetical protein [Longimicrobium sp.]HSU17905.1 hypothetical protein [Longimicrobium sp.]
MPRPTPARTARNAPVAPAPGESAGSLRFTPKNLAVLGAGLASIILGYVLLGNADNVLAPLLLVLGYAVLIPLGIIL